MKRKLTKLLKAIKDISPAEFVSMNCIDLDELERLSASLADRIEMQRIWLGIDANTNERSK